MKRITVFLLTITLLISFSMGALAKGDVDLSHPLSHEEALDIIYKAAIKYNDKIAVQDISIDGKREGEDDLVTKSQSYAMVLSAFDLSKPPTGNNKRMGIFDKIPEGIEDENVKEMAALGILTPDEISDMTTITAGELNRILSKIYTYLASNKNDDFYTATSKEWFKTVEIPAGYSMANPDIEIMQENDKRIEKIILDAVKSDAEIGSVSQKLGDFYKSFIDLEKRNRQGTKPLREYLDMIDGVKTVEELVELDVYFNDTLGTDTLFNFAIISDSKDNKKNSLYYFGLPIGNSKPDYLEAKQEFTEAYLEYLTGILEFVGGNEGHAQAIYDLEKSVAMDSLDPQDYHDVDKYYKPYSVSDLSKIFTGFDFEKFMESYGFGETHTIVLYDEGAVKKSADLMVDDNLDVLKNISKVNLFKGFSSILGEEQAKLAEDLSKKIYGIEGEKTLQQKGVEMEKRVFSDYIGKLYADEYFSKEAKADVEAMVGEFIGEYKSMLRDNTWLSPQTRNKAIQKLSAINVKIGYPDTLDDTLDDTVISSDNIFENIIEINKAKNKRSKEELYQPVDKDKWLMSVYEVNAYYNPMANEIVFPAGILQGIFYDIDHSREENLGAIGMIIAHEITHSFDNNGSKYDKFGNANEWWTEKDKAKFHDRCSKLIGIFDEIEIIPGVFSDGTLTLSENIADLGGLKCALAVCKKDKDADLEKFFESYAKSWRTVLSREMAELYSKADVHSPAKLRVNRILSNIDEFYTTYGIKEGDDMYIPKELRVNIW